jgi:hypothetical protein
LRLEHLSYWIARDLYVAEYDGEILDAGDKIVVRKARIVEHLRGWNRRTARLAAADFAEAVLPIFEQVRPDDGSVRRAIEAARAVARGEIDDPAAEAAARAAAYRVTGAAAYAAQAAAEAVARYAAHLCARDAAKVATDAVAYGAAGDAAWTAAEAARTAQGQIILDYAYGRIG